MMQGTILLVVGCILSAVLVTVSIFTGYTLCKTYFSDNHKNGNVKRKFEEVACNDIKTTTITLSQYPNHSNQHRKRSQSDPEILIESVTLAIESVSSRQNSPESIAKTKSKSTSPQSLQTAESADDLSGTDDDEFNQSVSPLSTPKSQLNSRKSIINLVDNGESNSDEDWSANPTTLTYNNCIVHANESSDGDHIVNILSTPPNIIRHLAKLNAKTPPNIIRYSREEYNAYDLKGKISQYKKNIADLEDNSSKKERRKSVAKLELNRVVKSTRHLFEKSKK